LILDVFPPRTIARGTFLKASQHVVERFCQQSCIPLLHRPSATGYYYGARLPILAFQTGKTASKFSSQKIARILSVKLSGVTSAFGRKRQEDAGGWLAFLQ